MSMLSGGVGVLLLPSVLLAQGSSLKVRGHVYDSVARAPLAGAIVQAIIVDSARLAGAKTAPPPTFTALTDTAGGYELSGLSPGLYAVGFQHDALNALGLETPIAALKLSSDTTLDLAIASGAAVRDELCPRRGNAPEAALAGYLLDARTGAPMRKAAIDAEWVQVDVVRSRLSSENRRAIGAVYDDGRYRICGIPTDGPVLVRVTSKGSHSVETEMDFADMPLGRLDFHLNDTTLTRGTATVLVHITNDSGAALTFGRAVVAELGREVAIGNGMASVKGIPAGTWVVTLRALGFRPATLVVNAADNDTVDATVMMESAAVRLEGMTITDRRTRRDQVALDGAERRMRSFDGTLIRSDDPSLLSAFQAADGLRAARGFTYRGSTDVQGRPWGVRAQPCQSAQSIAQVNPGREVAVYLDGVRFPGGLESINRLVPPTQILAIEAYPDVVSAPPLWRTNDACAVIAFWTKH